MLIHLLLDTRDVTVGKFYLTVIVTKIIMVFGIITVFLKVCSICSKATERPTQTEIVSKSVTVFIIFQTNLFNLICILRSAHAQDLFWGP